MIGTILSMATVAAAQGLMMNPGGAIPAGVPMPNITGFHNATIQPSRGGFAICVSGMIPVQASATNLRLNFNIPANQSEVTQTFLNLITPGSPFVANLVAGTQNVSGTYNTGATMCMPANRTRSSTVQFLTHGVGFDRFYWDFAPGYSYVDYAAQLGYTTFFYDRLGVGMSAKPDPINVVQAPLEVAIAEQLIARLRAGAFGGQVFTKVVATGHSYGSIITQAVASRRPNLIDAAVLTGFTLNSSGIPPFILGLNLQIAAQNQPYRFNALNNGYLVSQNIISNQIAFLYSPAYDANILNLAEATKGSVTFGELFTTGAVTMPAVNYTGAVAVVNGVEDLPFCLGNCSYPTELGAAVQPVLFPAARNLSNSVLTLPDVAHGINLQYGATRAYAFIQNFVRAAGL